MGTDLDQGTIVGLVVSRQTYEKVLDEFEVHTAE